MKSIRVIIALLLLSMLVWLKPDGVLSIPDNDLNERVSMEFEYVDKLMEKAVTDGDMQGIAEAHRILSNLHVNLKQIKNNEKKARFTIAVGYGYVKMCPAVYFLQLFDPDNPTRFTIDCVGNSEKYFSEAVEIADKNLEGESAADTYFFAGIGMDRLKANMNNIPGAKTEDFFMKAKEYIGRAKALGASFDGVSTVFKRYDKPEYLKSPVIDDMRFRDLNRALIFGSMVPVSPEDSGKVGENAGADHGKPEFIDENTYLDYKWRFSIKRPDESWNFIAYKTGAALHLAIRKKNSALQEGSGLNIICSPIDPGFTGAPLEKIVEDSIALLKSAGYELDEGKNIEFAGMPAYEIKSVHKYNELIPAEVTLEGPDLQGTASTGLASQQYMVIMAANGIQYILSFSSLNAEYARIFPMYHSMAETFRIF